MSKNPEITEEGSVKYIMVDGERRLLCRWCDVFWLPCPTCGGCPWCHQWVEVTPEGVVLHHHEDQKRGCSALV